MKKAFFIVVAMLSSCSVPSETLEPCDYEKEAISGEYIMQTEEVNGDCGTVGELNVTLESGVVMPNDWVGCVLESDSWEQSTCTSRSVFDCDDGTWLMRLEWSIVTSLDEGQAISGELYAEMSKWNGLYTCVSTYILEGEKL